MACKLIFIDPMSLGIPAPAAFNTFLMLSQLKPLGCDGNSQPSVPAWLDSLGLQDYIQSFLSSGYSSIDTVKNLWELEIVNVSVASLLPGQRGLGLFPGASTCHKSLREALCPRCPWSLPAGAESEPAGPSEEDHCLAGRQTL